MKENLSQSVTGTEKIKNIFVNRDNSVATVAQDTTKRTQQQLALPPPFVRRIRGYVFGLDCNSDKLQVAGSRQKQSVHARTHEHDKILRFEWEFPDLYLLRCDRSWDEKTSKRLLEQGNR